VVDLKGKDVDVQKVAVQKGKDVVRADLNVQKAKDAVLAAPNAHRPQFNQTVDKTRFGLYPSGTKP
jgi:hypothetical protein